MPIAAIPDYLQKQDLSQASPGLRFGMYFQGWTHNWDKHIPDRKRNEPTALASVCKLFDNDKATMKALAERQARIAQQTPALLTLDAIATAPFTTGLGNEHPLENGFAFLSPYGLPYLPGSGIKGVLRQAARELASGEWGDTHGWLSEKIHLLERAGKPAIELSVIDALFGKESRDGDTDHVRGALSFWDAIPHIPGDSLSVDIMTPHQGHYYQQKKDRRAGDSTTPHDSGQPNPISFLTLPPQTRFAFHVQCDLTHLERIAPDLAADNRWQTLLKAAFEHAFEWLGFGAKTSVGYGAMETEKQRQRRQEEHDRQQEAAKEREKVEALLRQQANAVAWEGARVKFNRANGALTVEKSGKTAIAVAPAGEALLQTLPPDIQQKVRTNQFVKINAYVAEGVLVRVERT